MIGRADIEGSKSNVDLDSWLPQASYPCGRVSEQEAPIEALTPLWMGVLPCSPNVQPGKACHMGSLHRADGLYLKPWPESQDPPTFSL